MPTKKEAANAKLKENLKPISDGLHFVFGITYVAPTCLRCDGFLSKAQGSSDLICLKCEAKYELKEK